MEYSLIEYIGIKTNELWIYTAKWKNIDVKVSERS